MTAETRSCQNCKTQFTIELEDFDFYKKIDVPPPTWCPRCRLIRRMTWRNERALYKRSCDLCEKGTMAMYPTDAPFPVYCRECWYSDKWDATTYGRDYDFARPFFEQFADLLQVVPRLAMWQRNVINSDYSNMVGESKNVYLSCSVVVGCENVFYSKSVDASFNVFDSYNITSSDGCYENIDGEKNYNSHYLVLSRNCIDSRFLIDCVNCKNCFLSSNLRNKEYYIRNKQYSKEDYFTEIEKMDLGSRKSRDVLLEEFSEIKRKALYRYANVIKSPSSTGNNLLNVKNSKNCFDIYNVENSKYCYRGFSFKDCMDFDFGASSELLYEYNTGAINISNVKFSYSAMDAVREGEYTDFCKSATNIFGCVSLKNKENAILNKVYSKEEFADLRGKIIAQMNELPYRGENGREYRYGEFFPVEISPFAYNESAAQEISPLTKDEAIAQGYRWREPEAKSHTVTLPSGSIPNDIKDVDDTVLKEIIGCIHNGSCNHQCSGAFRLTLDELHFYRKQTIPLPNECPNCRHYERVVQVPPLKLWSRQCMCNHGVYKNVAQHASHQEGQCPNNFETPYAPDRPEIIYCEQCYQAEVS